MTTFAVVGATGLVGRTMLQVLIERGLAGDVRALASGRSVGTELTYDIEVLTQAREHLIRRTMESLKGAKRAIVHVYNATSEPFRDIVFGMSKAEVVDMAVSAVTLVKQLAAEQPETEWVLEYSPETFTATAHTGNACSPSPPA